MSITIPKLLVWYCSVATDSAAAAGSREGRIGSVQQGGEDWVGSSAGWLRSQHSAHTSTAALVLWEAPVSPPSSVSPPASAPQASLLDLATTSSPAPGSASCPKKKA